MIVSDSVKTLIAIVGFGITADLIFFLPWVIAKKSTMPLVSLVLVCCMVIFLGLSALPYSLIGLAMYCLIHYFLYFSKMFDIFLQKVRPPKNMP